jgi:glycosyltransferase involved in cell wall biosynthesis
MTPLEPVVGNDWTGLVPDAASTWVPTRTVSICVPTRNPGPGLRRTLLALTAQTYPHFEVVVADDGSDHPIEVPDGLSYPCRVVRQRQTLPFGAGQARNLAARAADGDILFFLDADVIPERQVVEAYARWLHATDLAVPMGLCRFVDVDGLDDAALVELVAAGRLEETFGHREVDDQGWRERTFARTHDLRREAIDAFRITIGATVAVGRSVFEEIGGFRELGVRGIEDTEFGYRLHANGAVLIVDRDAQHWHQGRRNLSTERRARIDAEREPYVRSLLPVRGFRFDEPIVDPPVEIVPRFRVVPVGGTEVSIECLPAGDVRVDETFDIGEFDPAFGIAFVPAGIRWSASTASKLMALFAEHPVGVIHLVSATTEGSEVTVVRTRALRRAVHAGARDDAVERAGQLFGVWYADLEGVGLTSVDEPPPPENDELADDRRPSRVGVWINKQAVAFLEWMGS